MDSVRMLLKRPNHTQKTYSLTMSNKEIVSNYLIK